METAATMMSEIDPMDDLKTELRNELRDELRAEFSSLRGLLPIEITGKIPSNLSEVTGKFDGTTKDTFTETVKAVIEQTEEEKEDKKEKAYADDTYSFIALGFFQTAVKESSDSDNDKSSKKGKKSKSCLPFLLGFVVFVFQVSLLSLMLISRAWKHTSQVLDVDNPDQETGFPASFVNANASYPVRVTQFLSTLAFFLFGGESLSDVVQAVLNAPAVFPSCDENYRRKEFPLQFACMLRFFQGVSGCLTAMMLVVSSNDVIDIVLNFTAVHFISSFDNLAFELAANGFYGQELFKATETVSEMQLPTTRVVNFFNDKGNRNATIEQKLEGGQANEKEATTDTIKDAGKGRAYMLVVGFLATIFLVILCIIFYYGDSEDKWSTHLFRVEFLDDELTRYSGCCEFNDDKPDKGYQLNDRRLQFSIDETSASFINKEKRIYTEARLAFCKEQKRWYLHKGSGIDNPCELNVDKADDSMKKLQIARSEQMLTFDIVSAFDSKWTTPHNKPIRLYFGENDANLKGDEGRDALGCGFRTRDAQCDAKLNMFEYSYDGGDCCPTSCDFRKDGDCEGLDLTNILKPISEIEIDENGKHPCKEEILVIPGQSLTGTIPGELVASLGQATALELQSNELIGRLPYEIGTMEELQYIHLEHNKLNGTIPGELGDLKELIGLSLYKNEFTGTIPSYLGNLTELKYLFLDDNELTGTIPAELFNLTEIQYLHLYGNFLKGAVPTEVGKLKDVRRLDLSHNILTGSIPTEIGGLGELTELQLGTFDALIKMYSIPLSSCHLMLSFSDVAPVQS